MSFFDKLTKVLGYPASAAVGLIGMGAGDNELVSRGFKGELTPDFLLREDRDKPLEGFGNKLAGGVFNVALDPLNYGPGIAKSAVKFLPAFKGSGVVDDLLRGANSFGKIEDATKIAKAGKAARLYSQGIRGVASGGGTPMDALAAASLMGIGENVLAKALPKIAKLSLQGANSQGIGLDDAINNVDELLSRPAIDPTRILGELGAGPQRFSNSTDDEVTVLLKELLAGPGPARPTNTFSSTPELNSLLVRGELGPAPVPRVSSQFTESTEQLQDFLANLGSKNELPRGFEAAGALGPSPIFRPMPTFSPSSEREMTEQILALVEKLQNPYTRGGPMSQLVK